MKASLFVLKLHTVEVYKGSGGTAPRILNLNRVNNKFRASVVFFPEQTFLMFTGQTGGPQNQSGPSGRRKTLFLPGIELQPVDLFTYYITYC